MRNKVLSLLAALVMIAFTTATNCYAVDLKTKSEIINSELQPQSSNNLYGAKGAKADLNLTLEEMLTYSIEDEYFARGYYSFVIEKFGEIVPFNNIVKAEELHIMAVKSLFPTYPLSIPSDKANDYITAPLSIKEALEVAEQIEIENIAMYERFLKENLPEDVKEIFTGLRNGSQNHLQAFQKALKAN
jgi:hypothetical protein